MWCNILVLWCKNDTFAPHLSHASMGYCCYSYRSTRIRNEIVNRWILRWWK